MPFRSVSWHLLWLGANYHKLASALARFERGEVSLESFPLDHATFAAWQQKDQARNDPAQNDPAHDDPADTAPPPASPKRQFIAIVNKEGRDHMAHLLKWTRTVILVPDEIPILMESPAFRCSWQTHLQTLVHSLDTPTTFLISAGPFSEVAVHYMYEADPLRHQYVDLGSAFDRFGKGHNYRGYEATARPEPDAATQESFSWVYKRADDAGGGGSDGVPNPACPPDGTYGRDGVMQDRTLVVLRPRQDDAQVQERLASACSQHEPL